MSGTEKIIKLSNLQKVLWPIERHELKKFLPSAALMFVILFNYNILRSLKDSLVIVSIGAESISFLKLWGVLPIALGIMVVYAKLVNTYKEEIVFYIITLFFLTYFLIFQLYLRPNADLLHPSPDEINRLALSYPFAKYFFYIYGKWIFCSFYIMSEMWGSAVLSLLFWQFINKISTTEESRRFYPMLIFLANFALILSGTVVKYYSDSANGFNDQSAIMDLVIIVIICGFVCIGIYRYMHLYVLTDPTLYNRAHSVHKPKKERLSMKESFKLIASSKYVGLVALLVISYGFSINLVEGPWKAKVRQLCPTEIEFAHYMGHFSFMKGIMSIFFVMLGSNILRRCSWLTTALIAPIIFLISGTAFFALCVFQDDLSTLTYGLLGVETLNLVVTVGTIQNILSRCSTFSFFDPTKEIVYIPLDKELKTKGKAAVDIVGTRLGKSGSALIQSLGLTIFHTSSLISAIPYLMAVFIIVQIIWIRASIALNKEYLALVEKKAD